LEYYFIKLDIKWIPLLIITAINVGLWQLAPSEGSPVSVWHTVIIFVQWWQPNSKP